ncbi:MAG: hypothetical protein RL196_1347 [Actinomycetota bacterium]|jgi:hypothetical protein
MNKQRFFIYFTLGLILIINLASASIINTSSSDNGPFEQVFAGQCASPTVSLVYEDPTKHNPKVIEVDLTGDFSACVGSQVLVTLYKTGHVYAYGVADIVANQGPIQLFFQKKQGDFYENFPQIVNGRLVSSGQTRPSSDSIDPAEIVVVFAWSWT